MTGVPAILPAEPAEGDEPVEATPAIEPYEPISAIARIRIGKRIPDPVEDEDGNLVQVPYNEEDLEELPIDDKCLTITTNNGEQSIFCINQAVGRVVRSEIIKEMANYIPALSSLDLGEFQDHCE